MRRAIAMLLLAVSLVGCGKDNPTRPARTLGRQNLGAPTAPGAAQPQPQAGAPDARVQQLLGGVRQMADTSKGADIVVKLTYYKDDGSIKHVRSRYKFQRQPQRNFIEVLGSNEEKVVGTKVSWKTDGKAAVRTKFIGFWITVTLDLHDDRLRDQRGNFLDETSIERSIRTLLDPGARVSFKTEGSLNGKPMVVLDVVSPLSLKPTTREVYGIDTTTFQPILREMYKGDKLIWKMVLESSKPNPSFTAKDWEVD